MLHNLRQYFVYFDIELDDDSDEAVLDSYLSLGKYHAVTSPGHAYGTLRRPVAS